MAEMITMRPLFPGKTDVQILGMIFNALGTPSDSSWPGFGKLPRAEAFLSQLPHFDTNLRVSHASKSSYCQ